MTSKSNNAAGGTNGTTVSVANSGGASGTAWDSPVTIGSGATLIYDNTHIWDSPLAYKFATSATAATVFTNWTTSFNDDEVWGTIYCYFTSYAAAGTGTACIRIRGGAAVQAARLSWNTSGQVRMSDTTTANAVTMTTACPANAEFRLDYHIKVSTGASDVWLYKNNPDAPAGLGLHDDHISTTGALYGASNVNEFDFGCVTATSNVGPYWFANIAVSNIAIPGPPIIWSPSQAIVRKPMRGVPQRQRQRTVVIPGQTHHFPVSPRYRRTAPKLTRGRIATPVPTQAAVVAPVLVPRSVHRLRAVVGRIRGRAAMPVQPQVFLGPAPAIQPVRRMRAALARTRGHAVGPVPPQVVVVAAAIVIQPVHRLRQAFRRLHGKSVTPIPLQAAPQPRQPKRPRLLPGRQRAHVSGPTVVHQHNPVVGPKKGHKRSAFGLRRPHVATPVPIQAAIPPARAPQPAHRRAFAFIGRRAKSIITPVAVRIRSGSLSSNVSAPRLELGAIGTGLASGTTAGGFDSGTSGPRLTSSTASEGMVDEP